MIIRIILFISLLFPYVRINGQQKPVVNKNSLFAGIGINDFHIRDNRVSPLVYSNPIFTACLGYTRDSKVLRHNADAIFSTGNINTKLTDIKGYQKYGNLSYSVLMNAFRFNLSNIKSNLFLGTGLSSFISQTNLSTYAYYNLSSSESTWYWSHSLNFSLHCDFNISNSSFFRAKIAYPLVRLVSRPDYSFSSRNDLVYKNFLNAFNQGEIEYLWNNFVVYSELFFETRLDDDFSFRANYTFNYAHSNVPQSMGLYTNNLNAGIVWNF